MASPKFVLCVISKRPELLGQSLPQYVRQMPKDWGLIVFDDDSTLERNRPLISKLSKDAPGRKLVHTSGAGFSRAAAAVGQAIARDVTPLFENFGGIRNSALLLAAAFGASAVFVDDDTVPLYNFFDRYERLFAKNYLLVPGGFEGHLNLTSAALLYELGQVSQDWDSGTAAKIESIVRGVPSTKGSYTMNMFVGGNMGIANSLLRQLPFFPTRLRVEDAVFRLMAGERFDGKIYLPRGYPEAYETVPLAEHRRGGGKEPLLRSQLENELKGSVAAKVIMKLGFGSLERQTVVTDEQLRGMLKKAAEETWSEFGVQQFQRNIREGIEAAGSKAEALEPKSREEITAILSVDKSAAYLPMAEMKKELDRFSFTLKAWPYVMAALEDEKVKTEVIKAVG